LIDGAAAIALNALHETLINQSLDMALNGALTQAASLRNHGDRREALTLIVCVVAERKQDELRP
jgi:hypothetical protein